MSIILYGKPCAEKIGENVRRLAAETKGKLYLAGFQDEKWEQYTRSLCKSAEKYGICCENIVFGEITPNEFYQSIGNICKKNDALGVMLQQPLPKMYADAVKYIAAEKDVDCLSPLSVAKLYSGEAGFRPATPSAVLSLLDYYDISLCGKNVAIIGRGSVGKPLALMALARNATVTVCHSKTKDLSAVCRSADVIISACGVPNIVTSEFVTERSVVIDVGLSFVNGKTSGDVSEEVYGKCYAVSPVPGGVGPVTRMALFLNLFKSVK